MPLVHVALVPVLDVVQPIKLYPLLLAGLYDKLEYVGVPAKPPVVAVLDDDKS